MAYSEDLQKSPRPAFELPKRTLQARPLGSIRSSDSYGACYVAPSVGFDALGRVNLAREQQARATALRRPTPPLQWAGGPRFDESY